jgi:2-phospho-L-lactate guanylyltransferase
MVTWALVPVKPFRRAKSRLAETLSAGERAAASREFLAHVLGVLAEAPEIAAALVVSRDEAALYLAAARGARGLLETPGGLNHALDQGARLAAREGAEAVLVLPADLPVLAREDVRALLRAGQGPGPTVVIAPDRHERGTNALLVRPPGLLRFAFGDGSFARHQALARAAGAAVRVVRSPGTGLDVDVLEDWQAYQAARQRAAAG